MSSSSEPEQAESTFDFIDSLPQRPSEEKNASDAETEGGDCPLVQTLYEGPRKCSCCVNWVDYVPANADIDAAEEEGVPLIVRNSVTRGEDTSRVSIHSVEVRDAAARAALFPVFEGFDSINPSINYLVFHAPFKPFFYRWTRFEEAVTSCAAPRTREILARLHAIVKAELAEAFSIWDELVKNGVISYPYLWTIFQPGEILCEDTWDGAPRFYYLQEVELFHQPTAEICLHVQHVEYVRTFNLISTDTWIGHFHGTRPITSLPLYPARFLPDHDSVKKAVIARGQKYCSLAGVHYKEYTSRGEDGAARRIVVDSRDDPTRGPRRIWNVLGPHTKLICDTGAITQVPLDAPPPGGHRSLRARWNDESPEDEDIVGRPIDRRRDVRRQRRPRSPSPDYGGDDSEGETEVLDEFYLQLCTNIVRGFCLKEKEWRAYPQNFDLRRHKPETNSPCV